LNPASAGVSIVGSGSLTTIEGGYDGTLEISISGSVVAGRIKTLTPAASALRCRTDQHCRTGYCLHTRSSPIQLFEFDQWLYS
jgi:hypothetical protein